VSVVMMVFFIKFFKESAKIQKSSKITKNEDVALQEKCYFCRTEQNQQKCGGIAII
jgi:hypothetical protein